MRLLVTIRLERRESRLSAGKLVSPGWFAVAVQALIVLAHCDEACPSAAIADNLHAHAVSLRRVMAQLVRVGIVAAHEGRDGGYTLGRPADRITLAEVYEAVKASGPIDLSSLEPPHCAESMKMHTALAEVATEAELSVIEVLSHHSIASLMERAEALE